MSMAAKLKQAQNYQHWGLQIPYKTMMLDPG